MRKILSLCFLLTFVLASQHVHAGDAMVHVGHNKLDPIELKVASGTTVVVHNMDEMPGGHTIVADDDSFQSPGLAKDESWSHTFAEPGVYSYSIKQHPSAKGKITVE